MTSKVLVTGATGLLGRQVVKAFEQAGWVVIGTGFSRAEPPIRKLDLNNTQAVSELLEEERPQVVVHAAANRFPDKCDADPAAARAINVDATRTLVRAAVAVGSFVLYISTDYVFPGRDGEAPYEADATPEPTNLYAITKLDGERITLEETAAKRQGVVLRVPILYGPAINPEESGINALQNIVEKAQTSDQEIQVDDWAQRYPTHTADVARICKDIGQKYGLPGPEGWSQLPEVLQFTSEDRMTKYDVCEMFAEISGQRIDRIKPNRAGNDPQARVQRPYDTHLSTKALQNLDIPIWTQDFRAWWRIQGRAFRH